MPSVKVPIAALFSNIFAFPTVCRHYRLPADFDGDILGLIHDQHPSLFDVTDNVRLRHDALFKELQTCKVTEFSKTNLGIQANHPQAVADWQAIFRVIQKVYGPSFNSQYFAFLREHKIDAHCRLTKQSLRLMKNDNPLAFTTTDSETTSTSSEDEEGEEIPSAGTLEESEKDLLVQWLFGVERGFKVKRKKPIREMRLELFSDALFRMTWDRDSKNHPRLMKALTQRMDDADTFWKSECFYIQY